MGRPLPVSMFRSHVLVDEVRAFVRVENRATVNVRSGTVETVSATDPPDRGEAGALGDDVSEVATTWAVVVVIPCLELNVPHRSTRDRTICPTVRTSIDGVRDVRTSEATHAETTETVTA